MKYKITKEISAKGNTYYYLYRKENFLSFWRHITTCETEWESKVCLKRYKIKLPAETIYEE